MRLLVFLILLSFITGCTTIGSSYVDAPIPEEGQSLIYIFRAPVSYGNFWITKFLVDDKEVVSLYDKGYSWVHLSPGEHKFTAYMRASNELSISGYIKPNEVYYIGYGQENIGYQRVRNTLKVYEKREGHEIISQYSYKPEKTTTRNDVTSQSTRTQ